jgi:UDP-2,3-diacylglucosamine hydrolase
MAAFLATQKIWPAVKKTLIFSDVHLKVTEAHKPGRDAFIHFLKGFSPDEYDRIICLGDLFDFWFEYQHVIFSDFFDVLRVFADLHDAGVELHLICGNHDFWAGRFLKDELGFQVHPNTVTLPFGDKRGLLVHGDGINPKDTSYRFYKCIARNPFVVWAFRQLHPDWAMGLARAVSHSSRTLRTREEPEYGPEANALSEFAQGVFERGEADIVFCGHSHAPMIQKIEVPNGSGLYINSGDMITSGSHVIWDGNQFHLEIENEKAISSKTLRVASP